MGNVITHNISAINTLRNLNSSNRMLSKSLQKLSSGYRINTGADGPADLIISEQLRAQTTGLERAVRNTQEAINVIGIAEGALNEMNEILKTMRSLALHAANSGITSPEQVAADQSEVDSAIQTIDRIANTTKYSDQFLLNGAKALTFTRTTNIDKSTDHALLDLSKTRFDQIFKTKDYAVNISFTGAADTDEDYTDGTAQARRAMLEAFSGIAGTQIDTTNENSLSGDQRFTITGTKGARNFQFGMGTHLGEVVSSINNVADSIGVGAQLMFDEDVTGNALTAATNTGTLGRAGGQITAFHMDSDWNGDSSVKITSAAVTAADVKVGFNTDGFGRVYAKWTSSSEYDLYKDADLTMKIGEGSDGVAATFIRDADIGGFTLTNDTVAGGTISANHVTMVQLGSVHELDGTDASGFDVSQLGVINSGTGSMLSGVDLGYNTDTNGKLYFKVTAESGAGASDGTVQVYKDSRMREEDLVAESGNVDLGNLDTVDDGDLQINVYATRLNGGDGPSSNLYGALYVDEGQIQTADAEYSGEIAATNLGVRMYSTEYGADEYVNIDVQEGQLFSYYSDADDNTTAQLLNQSGAGESVRVEGQDATITINGIELSLEHGTNGTVSTQDINAYLDFDEGELGLATIAQTGYDVGGIYSRAQEVNNLGESGTNGNWATNAIRNSSERLTDFIGGMQFQLGEGQGDQERTTYAIQSMAVANLGKTEFYDDFEGKGLKETKQLTMQDILGGGLASLSVDPVKALTIIDKAINDVSSLRARLGATQKNLLQTNANSLAVAIENITATESDIRDANMAQESTDFTKNQILVQAGTAMLAQANVTSQNVLQLLG